MLKSTLKMMARGPSETLIPCGETHYYSYNQYRKSCLHVTGSVSFSGVSILSGGRRTIQVWYETGSHTSHFYVGSRSNLGPFSLLPKKFRCKMRPGCVTQTHQNLALTRRLLGAILPFHHSYL